MHTLLDVSYFAQLYSHIHYAKQQPILPVTCLSSRNNSSWALSPDRFRICSFSFYYGQILHNVRTWGLNEQTPFHKQCSHLHPFPWGSRRTREMSSCILYGVFSLICLEDVFWKAYCRVKGRAPTWNKRWFSPSPLQSRIVSVGNDPGLFRSW